jgi:hypothetical protein
MARNAIMCLTEILRYPKLMLFNNNSYASKRIWLCRLIPGTANLHCIILSPFLSTTYAVYVLL